MTRSSGLSLAAVALVAWAAAPAPLEAQSRARQGLLSLEDARLFYEVIGAGDPVIVVHGGPGLDHNYLRPGLDVLAATHRLVYYDQRGTGRSGVELDEASVSLDQFVEDIDRLRMVLGYDRVTVLAHSFGVLFGIEYALRHPERLRALVLMSPAEPGTRFAEQTRARQASARTAEDAAELGALTSSEGFRASDPATLSQVYRVAFRGTMKDRARVSELNLDLGPNTAENGQTVAALLGASLGEVDWWDRLGGVEAPTLVIHGRHDLPPAAMAEALVEAIPNASLAVLDSGHFPYLEDPEGLASAVAGFFARLGR